MKPNFLAHKKVKMGLVGIVTEVLMFVIIQVMKHFGMDISHEMQVEIHRIIALIIGAFIASQGFADGVSKGATSSSNGD